MVKMKKSGLGLVIPKTLRIGGVTFYQRVETGDDRSRRTTRAGERRVCRLYERLGTGTRHWRPLLAADYPDPLHALPTVHDRRSLAACRQELWRHHRQALSFAKIGEEGYTLKILFEKIKRE